MHSRRMGTPLTMLRGWALAVDVSSRYGEEVVGAGLAAALDEPEYLAGISAGTRNRVEVVALSNFHCPFEGGPLLVHVSPFRLN